MSLTDGIDLRRSLHDRGRQTLSDETQAKDRFGDSLGSGRWFLALGVDAASPTGTTRLYEGAGMTVAQQYATYRKELRPGVEPGHDEGEE